MTANPSTGDDARPCSGTSRAEPGSRTSANKQRGHETSEAAPVESVHQADAACILEIREGRLERFEELVTRYQATVYSVALGYVREPNRAEDLAQETFVNAFKSLDQLREPERFLAWLLQIARNRASREMKKSARRSEQALSPEFDVPAAEENPDAARAAHVFSLVEELDEPYRHTVLLKYKQGMSCKEIAAHEGVPVGTITSRLTRALAVLRNVLGAKKR